jgi:hypothetical protein
MKLFADENVAKGIVQWLRANLHDVLYAPEELPGAPDADWLARAEQEERIVQKRSQIGVNHHPLRCRQIV